MAAPAGDGRARLVVSARVVFTGPVFGMRGLIESSSLEARPCAQLQKALQGFKCAMRGRGWRRAPVYDGTRPCRVSSVK